MKKTILITGSSRGIGKATAKLAHDKGYKVILHGKTFSKELEKLNDQLSNSYVVAFDIADKQATHKAITEAIKAVGPIDVLVNNAGMGRAGIKDVADIDDEQAVLEYKNNVLGTIHCIQAVLPSMLKQGSGTIISVSSIKGHDYLTSLSSLPYGITKAGVLSLSKALAKEYPTIRFNTVSPGYTKTDMAAKWSPETFDKINQGTLVGRIGQPEEIAAAVMFLASDEASYVSGVDLLVDGGFAIKGK